MKTQKSIFTISVFLLAFNISSCKKYLDQKPQKNLVVPSKLSDLQAILDNNTQINQAMTPVISELAADNYYVTTAAWEGVFPAGIGEPLNYIWDKNAEILSNWSMSYQGPIYYSNVVLESLPKIERKDGNKIAWDKIKGSALFYRSFAFYQLTQIYCRPFSSSATTDLGIVLKLTSNINETIVRSTIQQSYDQIINDLKLSVDLLPAQVSFPTQPTKAAAYGTLARVYLSMSDYTNARIYADLCLQQHNSLLDYNSEAIGRFNIETIYFNRPILPDLLNAARAKIDSSLYQSYDNNDLRKTMFFKSNGDNTYKFNGSYFGPPGWLPFDGIATDEIYLIRAECHARNGNKDDAMADLNALMIKRWSNNGSWTPFTAIDPNDAKNKVLAERRKELLFRGLRWSDLRRFNLEGANITLKRIINHTTYTLPPNDLRWVMLIPTEVIIRSTIKQNPR